MSMRTLPLVLILAMLTGCPDNGVTLGASPLPSSLTVHNDRPFDAIVDSGAWHLDVAAGGSATLPIEDGEWAVYVRWEDGAWMDPFVLGCHEYAAEILLHDTMPPSWSLVP